MNNFIMEKKYEIHYYEVDYKKRASITSIINYFGDIATKQSEERNVGIEYMEKNKIAWVIYKWHINVYKYPIYGQKIIIRTIPVSFRKFYAYRNFEVFNEKNEKIIEASSVWFLIDTEKRKPKRIIEDMFNAYGIDRNTNEEVYTPKIVGPKEIHDEKDFNIRYGDIDTNGHVNNAKYVSWILEVVPLDIVSKYTLNTISIIYKKESKYGQSIKSYIQIEETDDNKIICKHKILNNEGVELTLAETVWV